MKLINSHYQNTIVFLTTRGLVLLFFFFFFFRFSLILGKFSRVIIIREVIIPASKMRNTAAICWSDTDDSSIFQFTDESFNQWLFVRSGIPAEMILCNLDEIYNIMIIGKSKYFKFLHLFGLLDDKG